jgi:branched-chain amino acid transport system substrate-binding protein
MRILTGIIALLLAGVVSSQEIRLGLSAPLSGGGAAWGEDVRNILIFANAKIAGGKYRLIFEDDHCDSKHALTAAHKFAAVDHVAGAFIVCGQSTLATAEVYKKNKIPLIATLATPSRISTLGILRTSLNDALAAKLLARQVAGSFREVFVLTEENDYSVSFAADFNSAAKEIGIGTSGENYLSEQQDFKPLLLRLKGKKVAAVFLNTQTEETLVNILRQLREISYLRLSLELICREPNTSSVWPGTWPKALSSWIFLRPAECLLPRVRNYMLNLPVSMASSTAGHTPFRRYLKPSGLCIWG